MKRKSRRRMPPHIVLPNGQWRFVKRGRSSSVRAAAMPRYKRRRTVTMARYRKSGRRSGGFGGKGMIAPILAGVADAVINPRSPIDGLGSTAVGYFMHNETVKTIGLYQVGQSIATFIPFVGAQTIGGQGSQV